MKRENVSLKVSVMKIQLMSAISEEEEEEKTKIFFCTSGCKTIIEMTISKCRRG
jgi:hypothetical protein